MKHLLLLLLFCALLMAACSKPTITARHDIAACGVDDPLVNLPWLAKVVADGQTGKKDMEIYLIKSNNTVDNYFAIYKYVMMWRGNKISSIDILDCSSTYVTGAATYSDPPPDFSAFQDTTTSLGLIWSIEF